MSIQSQIDRITGEVNSQTDLIAQIEQVLVGKTAVGGGSGSGIIDVTELPTSGIDENAVYRLTEEVMIEEPQIYLKIPEGVISFKLYLTSLGVSTIPNIYEVDDLSNMLESDVATFSAVNIYILKSDGIAYAYVPAYGRYHLYSNATAYDKRIYRRRRAYSEGLGGVRTRLETAVYSAYRHVYYHGSNRHGIYLF